MMRQYFQNLAAEAGVSEFLLIGDKATLPSFDRRTSLTISFASSNGDTKSLSKFETAEDDFAPSFPMRKLSSGSLSSSSSGSKREPMYNSRWVSDPPLARSKSVSPVSTTKRSHRRNLSDELSLEIKSVILGDIHAANCEDIIMHTSPVVPQRKASMDNCASMFHAATALRRTVSAELVA